MASIVPQHPEPVATPSQLRREIGLSGACLMGLGSIVGTGIFVSLALAAGSAGEWLPAALAIAAMVAACNGLSSAQLAAAHPVSGGTYEYAYRLLHPALGFLAGWMFLCAKTASAATAALGCGGYLAHLLRAEETHSHQWLALLVVAILTTGIQLGMRLSNRLNAVLVLFSLGSLVVLIAVASSAPYARSEFLQSSLAGTWRGVAEAAALMFVAYTGYGRIATLGEEVRNPRRTIPRAVVVTLAVSALLYISVAMVSLRVMSPSDFAQSARVGGAPLQAVAEAVAAPRTAFLLGIGAMAAMASVLLNLMLGLSRVLLAMARRGDMPRFLAGVDRHQRSPYWAVLACAVSIAALAAVGDIRATWSFSALSVLVYYAITNLAALRLPADQRLVPRVIPVIGLISCLFLAVWIDPVVWMWGAVMMGAGAIWFRIAHRHPFSAPGVENHIP